MNEEIPEEYIDFYNSRIRTGNWNSKEEWLKESLESLDIDVEDVIHDVEVKEFENKIRKQIGECELCKEEGKNRLADRTEKDAFGIDFKLCRHHYSQKYLGSKKKYVFPIRSTYLNKIFSGKKGFEIRKPTSGAVNRIKRGDLILFYENGKGQIAGDASVIKTEKVEKEDIKRRLPRAGISSEELESYLSDSSEAILVHFSNPRKYSVPEQYKPAPQTVVRYDS